MAQREIIRFKCPTCNHGQVKAVWSGVTHVDNVSDDLIDGELFLTHTEDTDHVKANITFQCEKCKSVILWDHYTGPNTEETKSFGAVITTDEMLAWLRGMDMVKTVNIPDESGVSTVNVIETGPEFQIKSMKSWLDTRQGCEAAQEYFKFCAKETTPATDEEIQAALDDGILEVGDGAIVICHSTG